MTRAQLYSTALSAALGLALVPACTSFTFPGKKGQSSAPSELKDKSKMVKIPGGKFVMGWTRGDPDENPQHEVEVSGFLMGRTEVTVQDFKRCVDANVCQRPSTFDDPVLGKPNHPAVGMAWSDAHKYCEWVGKRLPTEAEWEYAARAPDFFPYPWKGKFIQSNANTRGTTDGYAKTAPVGSFPSGASGHGLLDMAGNASEWVADWYDASYYQNSPRNNPKGPRTTTGYKGVRGGGWGANDYEARSTDRDGFDPVFGTDAIGFRCAANA